MRLRQYGLGMKFALQSLSLLLIACAAFGAEDIVRDVIQAYKEGKRDEALAMVTKEIEKDPKNGKLFFTRGRLHAAMSQNEKAIEDYDRALKVETNAPAFFQERGIAHFKLGHI